MEEEHKEHKTQETHEESSQEAPQKPRRNFGEWYDKNYKKILFIPLIILLVSIAFMFIFVSQNGDFVLKDVSLSGGTTATIQDPGLDQEKLEEDLSGNLEDLDVRRIFDTFSGRQKGLIIETTLDLEETKEILEEYLGYELNSDNSSFEFTGSALSENFYKQLLVAIIFAFVFMAIVVFILFRTFVPSTAVIISAIADIFMTLVMVNFLGIKMSAAGIVAFLMLIGYSVDTDILLTNRVLKGRSSGHRDTTNKKIFSAFKTGVTMTLTSLLGILIALFVVKSFSIVLTQIFTVLVIGLSFDLLNTWTTNASILKWYVESKEKKGGRN
jgi:preprotein translocase subunit SecF